MTAVGPIRLACCVPFCGRTFKSDKAGTPWPEGSIVICGKHWRLASDHLRRRHRRLKRLQTRGLLGLPGQKVDWLVSACFDRIARQAIERAAGIA